MHTLMMSKSLLVKWALPIALVLALVASFTVVGASSGDEGSLGGSDDFGIGDSFGDFNPAYENVIVGPAEEEDEESALPVMLYSLDVENQSTLVALGGGDLMTLTLTNLIEEPIANGTYVVDGVAVNVTEHGDIGGNIEITADVYAPSMYSAINADAGLTAALTAILVGPGAVPMAQGSIASAMTGGASASAAASGATALFQSLPTALYGADAIALAANETTIAQWAQMAQLTAAGATLGVENWTMTQVALPIITYSDGVDNYLTAHPGKTVVVQVPIVPMVPVLSIIHYRAELVPDQNVSVLL